VLAASKDKDAPAPKKGKGADMAKWDAEVRKSLAAKKSTGAGAAPALSKQQLALVAAQREKETATRARVERVRLNLERGLRLVGALVDARAEMFTLYLSAVARLLVRGAMGKGPQLVGEKAFAAYLVRIPSVRGLPLLRTL
jgi:hypothetical protein